MRLKGIGPLLLLLTACAAGCANMREWARRDEMAEVEQEASIPRRGSRYAADGESWSEAHGAQTPDPSAARFDRPLAERERVDTRGETAASEPPADEVFDPVSAGEPYRPAARASNPLAKSNGNESAVRQAAAESHSARRFAQRADWLTPDDSPTAGTNLDEPGSMRTAADDRGSRWSFRQESSESRPERQADDGIPGGPPATIDVETSHEVQDGTLRIVRFDPAASHERAPESIARFNLMQHGNPLRSSNDEPAIEPLSPEDAESIRSRFAPVREQFRKEPSRHDMSRNQPTASEPPANGPFSSITWNPPVAEPAPSNDGSPMNVEARIVRAGYDDEWTASEQEENDDSADVPRRFVTHDDPSGGDDQARSPAPPIRIIGPDFRELSPRHSAQPTGNRWR
jgi:hypothetical protein